MVDGDKLLVVAQENFVEMAKKRMDGVNTLFYEAQKAKAKDITVENIYEGLRSAFSGGKIGQISNDITKVWNNGKITSKELDVIKLLVLETNYSIDSTKTMVDVVRPSNKKDLIKQYTSDKVPYFFQFAKNKDVSACEPIKNTTMNNISQAIEDSKISFSILRPMNKINYKMLVDKKYVLKKKEDIEKINNMYNIINKSYGNKAKVINSRIVNEMVLIDYLNCKMESLGYNKLTLANTLARALYEKSTPRKKNLFWLMYGEIIYNNLLININGVNRYCRKCGRRMEDVNLLNGVCVHCRTDIDKKSVKCIDCGIEFDINKKNNKTVRCKGCASKVTIEKNRLRKQKSRKKQ